MVLSWNLCSAHFNTSHILDRLYKFFWLSLMGICTYMCLKKKERSLLKTHKSSTPLDDSVYCWEGWEGRDHDHLPCSDYEYAQHNFHIANSSRNIWLWNMVFSFYFFFFHSCRNLEVTALHRGTGRELLLRSWWF